jgi:bacillithiol system protein YtxJ
MNARIRPLLLIAAWLTAATAVHAEKADPNDDLVMKDDVVTEWRNPEVTELTKLTEFAQTVETAKDKPVLIFKHSTTCPISGRAAQRVNTWLHEAEEEVPAIYMVKVIESRPVSNAIADRYEVKHESPQVLLIKDGKAVWNTSHDEITAEAIETALETFVTEPDE